MWIVAGAQVQWLMLSAWKIWIMGSSPVLAFMIKTNVSYPPPHEDPILREAFVTER